jgi:hypothetical protein
VLCAVGGTIATGSPAEARRRRREPTAEPASPPLDAAQQAARDHYNAARRLFDEGNHAQALVEFQAAYDARPHPQVLLAIAECLERLERWDEAAQKLEVYVQASPDASDRADIERRIAAIRARPAVLRVTSSPEGASIRLDGTDTGKVTPADVEAPAGEHDLVVGLAGYDDASEHLVLHGAERREVSITLVEAPPEEPASTASAAVDEDDAPGGGAAVWIFGGLTGVALVGGTVLGFLALSDQSEYEQSPSVEIKDRGERMALFADIGFGVAVVAGVTTIILATTGGSEDSEEGDEALRVVPVAGAGGAGAVLQGAF